jgi:hypothetical protein
MSYNSNFTLPLDPSSSNLTSSPFGFQFAMVQLNVAYLALYLFASSTWALAARPDLKTRWSFPSEIDVLSVTIQELQQFLTNGTVTSVQLVQKYLVSSTRRLK